MTMVSPSPARLKVLNYLPRNMHFGPRKATSIDLCVYEQSLRSAHEILVVCDEIDEPFDDLPVRMLKADGPQGKMAQLQSIISEYQPDLIVVQQHGPTAQKVAALFKTVPVLLHRHNFEIAEKLSWFRKWRHKRRYEALSGLVFVSDTCRDSFLALYPSLKTPVYTVHNGIDCSLWQAAEQKNNEILFVGRIEPQKNALPAAKAMAQLLARHPQWTGCLVGPFTGSPDYVGQVKKVVEDCEGLTLLDGLPHQAVKERLQKARISLICSERESFCLVATESFAAGAGVVSTANGALPETVGNAGIFLESIEVEDILKGLEQMVGDYPHYVALGYEQVKKFDLHKTVSILDDVYSKTARMG
nr:glycosyltransferase family 4 protein [uncultured Cohaesibacter sp.]